MDAKSKPDKAHVQLMKKLVTVGLFALSLLSTSRHALGAEPDKIYWEQAGWQVAVMLNASGRFVGCYTVKDFNAPIFIRDRFVFSLYRDGHWAGLVGGTRIDSIAQQRPISLYADGKLIHRATPQLTSLKAGRLGTLSLQAIDGVASAHVLEMLSPAGRDRYILEGSADALAKTVECVNSSVALEQGRPADALGYQFRVPSTVSAGFMNMRSAPSTTAPLVGTVPAGEGGLAKIGDCRAPQDGVGQSNWCYMQWHGMAGWISTSGLMEEVATIAPPQIAQPTAAPAIPPAAAIVPAPPSKSEPSVSSGTAFMVGSNGQLLTNAHVVKDCKAIAAEQPGVTGLVRANVLAQDRANDLALIQVSPPFPNWSVPKFRQHIRLGEDVFVFGYPLTGIVASSGNFTRGSVTALAGIGDDTGKLQLTAPVQPGNSGGPVLDQTGAVVGVVVSKLDALSLVKATGNFPEQINFAIKASAAASFLESNGVEVSDSDANAPTMSAPDIADAAKKFTAHVWCLGE